MPILQIKNQSISDITIVSLDNLTIPISSVVDIFDSINGGFSEYDVMGNTELQGLIDSGAIRMYTLDNNCQVHDLFDSGLRIRTVYTDPTVYSTDQTYYAPNGLQESKVVKISCTTNIKIHSMLAGYDGELKLFMNQSTSKYIDLMNQSTSGTDDSKFLVPENTQKFRVLKLSQIFLMYTDDYWRPILERQSGTV